MAETIFETRKETAIENQIKGAKKLKEGLKKGTSVYNKELSVEKECEDFLETNEVFISRMLGDNAHHAICQSENHHDRQNQLRKYIEHEIDHRIKIMELGLKELKKELKGKQSAQPSQTKHLKFDVINISLLIILLFLGVAAGHFIKKGNFLKQPIGVSIIVGSVFSLLGAFLRNNPLTKGKEERIALVLILSVFFIGGGVSHCLTPGPTSYKEETKTTDIKEETSEKIQSHQEAQFTNKGEYEKAKQKFEEATKSTPEDLSVQKELIYSRTLSETLTSEIRGCVVSVVNHNKGLEPLEGAKITIVGHKKSVFSDSLGNFSLGLNDVPTDSQVELQVEKEGFEPQKRNIVPNRTTEPIYIELKPIL